MSIASNIRDAREILSDLLDEAESSSTVPNAPYSVSSIKSRKWYWNCSKASRILAELSSHDFPKTTEEDLKKIRAMDSKANLDPNQRWTEAFRDPNSLRAIERPYRPVPTPVMNPTPYINPSIRAKNASNTRLVNTNSAHDSDKLKMEGFAAVKAIVGKHDPTSRLRSEIPYISLGDLGIAEGWTNILTNAAYCYDNTPVEGWRREVSIRRSGKTKGGIDIHYVTPDKKRRFRSRQELQSYLTRISSSVDFINKFDFRSVFCVCQQCEDHNRSYLECSYGYGGCNHWIHPECVGLGVRSEEELALMPRVICPYCAAYLEGTGEAATIVKPDMLVLGKVSWNAVQRAAEVADDIEESSEPHVLWGLQGTSFVYCSASGKSGRDVENLPAAGSEEVLSFHRNSTFYSLPSSAAAGAVAAIPSSSSSTSNAIPPSSAPELDNVLQHRLFQSWQTIGNNSSSAVRENNEATAVLEVIEKVIPSDDDEGVPSNPNLLEPMDRVRRARHLDGTTSMVRIDGGWMSRKKPRLAEDEQLETSNKDKGINSTTQDKEMKGQSMSIADTSNDVSEEVGTVDLADRKRRILEKAAERAVSDGTSVFVPNQYKNELIEAAVNAAQSSSHRHKNIVTPAMLTAAVNGTVPVSVAAQTLSDLRTSYQLRPSLCYLPLEDGGMRFTSVSFAQVPRSVHPLCLANLLCGVCMEYNDPGCTVINSNEDIPQKASNKKGSKKRTSAGRNVSVEVERFHLRPVDCGAVQYFVHTQCLHAASEDFLSATFSKNGGNEGQERSCSDKSDGIEGQERSCSDKSGGIEGQERSCSDKSGGVEGQERSCSDSKASKSHSNDKVEGVGSAEQIHEDTQVDFNPKESEHPMQKLLITLGGLYQYEQAEDAECDLCGRKGGVLRYFRLASHCSSLPAPSEDGWLAHVPCLQHLHSSRLLQPLIKKSSSVVSHSDSFAMNPLSCDLQLPSILSSTQQQQQNHNQTTDSLQSPEENSCYTGTASAVDSAVNVDSVPSENKMQERIAQDAENNEEEESKEDEEGVGEQREKLLTSNRLYAQTPLSRFDQQYGLWRCTLCGLQCGIVPRCLGIACTVRAHPFCLLVTNNPLWKICSVVAAAHTANDTSSSSGTTSSGSSSNGSGRDSTSVGILCPVHSVGMLE